MIVINRKEDCCGCSACTSSCRVGAISMSEDSEGFLYPKVDVDICVECGDCESVCPVLNRFQRAEKNNVYAAQNIDQKMREGSSSGGIFSALANRVIDAGGVIFGAAFDENNHLKHTYVDDLEGMEAIRRSKYLQSDMTDSFQRVADLLKTDREVLFSGTPCQVAGLLHFLGPKHNKLLTVDIVCHSVPSPKVFREQIKELFGNQNVKNINFRDKRKGWADYSLTLTHDSVHFALRSKENPYMKGFLKGVFTRPSCHECPAKALTSGSDITLGDFWGVEKFHPKMADNKGTSLIITSTARGDEAFNSIADQIYFEKSTLQRAIAQNPRIIRSAAKNKKRELFFANFGKIPLEQLIASITKETRYKKFVTCVKKTIVKLKQK